MGGQGKHSFGGMYENSDLSASGKGEYIPGVGHMRGWGAGVATDGTSGTLLAPGALYTDTTNGNVYKNDGTLASPAYDAVGTAGENLSISTIATSGYAETSYGVGAKAGATVTVAEFGTGDVVHKTVLTCTATPITMADEAGVVQHGGVKLYDFPAGLLLTLGAVIDGSVTTPVHDDAAGGTIATWDGDIGLGTVVASNNNSLASTEQNILQSTATTTAIAQVANVDAVSAATLLTESAASWIDGTGTNPDLYLNLLIDDSANNDAHTALFTGTVSVVWINIGDK